MARSTRPAEMSPAVGTAQRGASQEFRRGKDLTIMEAQSHLMEIAQAYRQSTVLLTACKLGIFGALGRETRSVSGLAGELGFDGRPLEMVLLALTAEGLLERDGGGFRLVEAYAPYLLPGSPETQASIFNHNLACLKRWARLDEVVRSGQPVPRAADGPAESELRDFICGMANISRASSADVAERVDLSGYRRMLDLDGGPGTSAITFAQRYPELRCVVFDLEDVIAIAREEIEKAGLADRVQTCVGDYFADEFGEGFDLVYISNIIHSLAPKATAAILEKSHRALVDGGAVIIKDFFLEDDRTTPAFGAYFSINMLVATEGGKSYTLTETREILERAGFGGFETVDVAMASRLLIARKL